MAGLSWFKVYAAETLSDENFQGWDCTERGAWFTLLVVAWREGSIPGDQQSLAKLLHLDGSAMRQVWSAIGSRFVDHPEHPGRLTSPRLEKERDAAEILHSKKVSAGKNGAKSRWDRPKVKRSRGMAQPQQASSRPVAGDSDQVRKGQDSTGQETTPLSAKGESAVPGSTSPVSGPLGSGSGLLGPSPPPEGQDVQGGILPVGLGTGFGLAGARTDLRPPPPEAGKGGSLAPTDGQPRPAALDQLDPGLLAGSRVATTPPAVGRTAGNSQRASQCSDGAHNPDVPGATPGPATTQARGLPSPVEALDRQYPQTAALLQRLEDRGHELSHARQARTRRQVEADVAALGLDGAEAVVLAEIEARERHGIMPAPAVGWFHGTLHAAVTGAAERNGKPLPDTWPHLLTDADREEFFRRRNEIRPELADDPNAPWSAWSEDPRIAALLDEFRARLAGRATA